MNGENKIFGEFLVNAQGEDVVAGIRTPQPIDQMKESFPDVYGKFEDIARILEDHYKDMQDMEFTVEEGKLFMLQTRNGKRTAEAAVKVAVDMVNEEKIDKETAIMRIAPEQIDQLLHPAFDAEELKKHTRLEKVFRHLRVRHAARSYSVPMMQPLQRKPARRLFWFVKRLLRKTWLVWLQRKVSSPQEAA